MIIFVFFGRNFEEMFMGWKKSRRLHLTKLSMHAKPKRRSTVCLIFEREMATKYHDTQVISGFQEESRESAFHGR